MHPQSIVRRRRQVLLEALESRQLLSTVTFGAPVSSDITLLQLPAVATATGDLNGDGIPDLVVSRQDQAAQVYLGSATGAFGAGSVVSTGGNPIALGDFNGDGKLDLLTNNGVLPGKGDGTFLAPVSGFVPPANVIRYYAEDVNGDGKLDLVAATFTPASGSGAGAQLPSIGITVELGRGDGSFGSPISQTIASSASLTSTDATFAFGDFNNDGKLDVMSVFGPLLGEATGVFQAPTALAFKATGSGGASIPAVPLLAVGDFNGDGNLDLATTPANGTSGQVEIFLGKGDGTFSDNGAVTIAAGDSVTGLTAYDLGATGQSDLVAGVLTSGQAASIAVIPNSQKSNATFLSPVFYSVSGAPISLTLEDFNADSTPDILSVNAAAGSTDTTSATIAAVLLGNKTAGATPTITLHANPNPVIVGSSLTLTGTLSAPAGSTLAAPSGTVTFMNGSAALGAITLVNGRGTLTTTASGVGIESITAAYSGDVNYAAASASLSLTVLATGQKVPLLIPAISSFTLPSEFLSGDAGMVSLLITNGGGVAANGKISVNLYLSASGMIDSSAIPLSAASLQNRAIHLAKGRSATLTQRLVAGDYPAGVYYLVAQVAPAASFNVDEISPATVASASTFTAAGQVFGTVGKHKGLRLRLTDGAGDQAIFALSGPGSGTVTQSVNGYDVAVTGSTAATTLSIGGHGPFTLDNLLVTSALAAVQARNDTFTGAVSINSVKMLNVAGLGSAGASAATLSLGAAISTTLSLGTVQNAVVNSIAVLKNVTASTWAAGALIAPGVTKLTVNGAFGANIFLHNNGKLTSAKLGSITGGQWAVPGGIGAARVLGDVSNAFIAAGLDAGSDNLLGSSDDAFTAAVIGSFFVAGADTSSWLLAGANVSAFTGQFPSSVTVLPGGAIRSITVRAAVSADSRFIASKFPAFVSLDGQRVRSSADSRFTT